VTDDDVAARIVETTLPGDPEDLPADAAESVREAARLVVAGRDDEATALLQEACPSPCAGDHPEPVDVGDGRRAACHRVDPAHDAPAEVDD
jgi:peptide/nickel transport system ATP-binding protein